MNMHKSNVRMCNGRLGLLLACTLFACTESGNGGPGAAIDRQADQAAIRMLIASNAAASTARNAEGVAATFTADGDGWIAGLGSEPTGGREALIAGEKAFTSMPGFQRWDGKIDKIRFISPDAAIAEVTGTTTMDSGRYQEKTTIVLARTAAGWRIAAWRVMDFDKTLLELLRG